jgi:hypothetical protein
MPARFFLASAATGDSQRRAPSTMVCAQTSNAVLNLSARDEAMLALHDLDL